MTRELLEELVQIPGLEMSIAHSGRQVLRVRLLGTTGDLALDGNAYASQIDLPANSFDVGSKAVLKMAQAMRRRCCT